MSKWTRRTGREDTPEIADLHGYGYHGSMRFFRAAGLLSLVGGCYSPVTELVTPHVEAGGTVTAALDAGPERTTKALADATGDPMKVDGTSPDLVFGLVVGDDDLSGMPAKDQLLAGKSVQMTVTPTARAQLSVHTGGQSCAATTAVVHLSPDGKGHLDGDFAGSGAGCQLGGTLSGIPIDR